MAILFPILAFFLPLALYIKTLSPVYIPVDSAEFTLCMQFWGICHPPGFPLFTILGKIFIEIFPLGTVIYKANLVSAIFGAATCFIIYLTLVKLKVEKYLAFFVSLLLAVNSIFWEFSTAADVFTFGAFLIALTFYFAVQNKPLLTFFTLGLASSHFYITAILWPLFAWHFLRMSVVNGQWSVVKWLFLFALGFFPQLLMYLRMQANPVVNWGHAEGITGFLYFIQRREFGSIFLLANPTLQFSTAKLLAHFKFYFINLFTTFGIFLPILIPLSLFFKNRKLNLIFICFLLLVIIQLFLLSTIDPTEADSPFQNQKFYISSFVPAVLLMGAALSLISQKFFGGDKIYARLLAGLLVIIYLLANLKTHDFSKNYFSQNLVLDAMEQLPAESVAVTLDHSFYFGTLYEQKVNGKFTDIKIIYFPNEKNRDAEKYHPKLFGGQPNTAFIQKIKGAQSLGSAENYILETVARNLDKPVFILQGQFEENFFAYLKPALTPYGLWWQVSESNKPGLENFYKPGLESMSIYPKPDLEGWDENLRNENIKFSDLHHKNQRLELLVYAVSYHSAGLAQAKEGNYDKAVALLKKSLSIRPQKSDIQGKIDLILKTREQEENYNGYLAGADKEALSTLGTNYFSLARWQKCAEVFEEVVSMDSQNAKTLSNLASCQALSDRRVEAKTNYQKALELDPNLELAKQGLDQLTTDN